jgi:hypothetical protein
MLEERKYERFFIIEETRALACDKIAKVIDISKGGLSLLFLDEPVHSLSGELSLDLLCSEKRLDARQIPGKIVWNLEVSFSSTPGMVYKKVGVQFGKLSPTQQELLKVLFLQSNAMSA